MVGDVVGVGIRIHDLEGAGRHQGGVTGTWRPVPRKALRAPEGLENDEEQVMLKVDARVSSSQALVIVGPEAADKPGQFEFGMQAELRVDGAPFTDGELQDVTVSQSSIGSFPASVHRVRHEAFGKVLEIAELLEGRDDPLGDVRHIWQNAEKPFNLEKLEG